jgi:uncharacterized membrane protein YjjP (DUF1212 family)
VGKSTERNRGRSLNWYKTSQKSIDMQEIKKIYNLIDKIVSGKRDYTEEELQLQANHSDIIEKLLKQRTN